MKSFIHLKLKSPTFWKKKFNIIFNFSLYKNIINITRQFNCKKIIYKKLNFK